ncbi:LysR substrate-binding domain-containing protein [Melaminivora sp.]|uniref:LysR substrate-binding domain-containing protein n=1 Tax=Melaminivora sp. TaxID=1933032 RepID=UPI0028AD36F8|nr:LysR substrate-binding domain-containing protein [Melaminivora sp.]
MRLRHIEVFNAVMLTGSVSAAARLINVTQPAVSRILAHAELQLGFALFQRTRGRLVPTREAQILHPHVEQLFAQLGDVQRLAARLRQEERKDELRILTVFALSFEVLPRALRAFRAQYPGVAVTIDALHSPQIVAALVRQEADLGFVFTGVAHPSLAQEHLADGAMLCVAPRGLLAPDVLARGSVQLADLDQLPFVQLAASDPVGTMVDHACREAGARPQVLYTVQTYHAALALAQHGQAVALIDACTAASADRGKVDVLPLLPRIAVPVHSLRLAQGPGSLLADAMARCMREALAQTLAPSVP